MCQHLENVGEGSPTKWEVPRRNEKQLRMPADNSSNSEGLSATFTFPLCPPSTLDMERQSAAAKGLRGKGTRQRRREASHTPFPLQKASLEVEDDTLNCEGHFEVFKYYLSIRSMLMTTKIVWRYNKNKVLKKNL